MLKQAMLPTTYFTDSMRGTARLSLARMTRMPRPEPRPVEIHAAPQAGGGVRARIVPHDQWLFSQDNPDRWGQIANSWMDSAVSGYKKPYLKQDGSMAKFSAYDAYMAQIKSGSRAMVGLALRQVDDVMRLGRAVQQHRKDERRRREGRPKAAADWSSLVEAARHTLDQPVVQHLMADVVNPVHEVLGKVDWGREYTRLRPATLKATATWTQQALKDAMPKAPPQTLTEGARLGGLAIKPASELPEPAPRVLDVLMAAFDAFHNARPPEPAVKQASPFDFLGNRQAPQPQADPAAMAEILRARHAYNRARLKHQKTFKSYEPKAQKEILTAYDHYHDVREQHLLAGRISAGAI